jgi:hypothetical protein
MAAVVASVNYTEFTSSMLHVYGTITASGSYTTAGDALTFAGFDQIKTDQIPVQCVIYSARPASSPQTNVYEYQYTPGTSISTGKMQVFTGAAAQTALTELSSGAYPAGVTGDTINFHAVFPKNI